MNPKNNRLLSRRDFLKDSSRFATASALAGVSLPHVHAAGSDLIRVALIGCGNRGTGAVTQALSTTTGPIKLVAMADVFENRLKSSFEGLKGQFADKMDVPEDRKFLGFEAYKQYGGSWLRQPTPQPTRTLTVPAR